MVTGLPPHRHGASRNGLRMLEGLDSLPKILARNGWSTAAFVSNWTLMDKLSRLGEHFDHYEGVFTRMRWFGILNREATAADVTDRALEWTAGYLRKQPEEPLLLWVHYVEPHAPYRFQKRFAKRLGISGSESTRSDRYDTEVAAVDHEIGRLLDGLEEQMPDRQMLQVFLADHGESLGEHGYWGHGRYLYEPSLKIPMGIVWPGRIEAGTIDAQAQILDIPPTLLELLGLEVPADFSGMSWAGVLAGDEAPTGRAVCYQAHKGAVHGDHESDRARSKGLLAVALVVDGRKEIIRFRGDYHMIFDLGEDPEERRDVALGNQNPSPELMRCVGEISTGLGSLDRLTTNALDDESVEQLRALGYLE
jgi:arylsulfatase A-like enzyme